MGKLSYLTGLAVIVLAWPHAEARASLLSEWNFDQAGGSVATDSQGSVNGALHGDAAMTAGAGINGSGALSLTQAGGGYVDMGDNFNFSSSYSLEAWIRLSAGDTNAEMAVGRHHATEVAGYLLAVNNINDGCNNSNNGAAHFYSEYPCSGNSTTAVNDGQWHQLVATYNATGGVASIYVDGHLEAASSGTVLNPVSGVHFMVGGIFGVTYQPQATYTGLIDNVAVWDNALSESDVHALYASETSAATPEPGSIVMMLGGALAIAPFLRRRN